MTAERRRAALSRWDHSLGAGGFDQWLEHTDGRTDKGFTNTYLCRHGRRNVLSDRGVTEAVT